MNYEVSSDLFWGDADKEYVFRSTHIYVFTYRPYISAKVWILAFLFKNGSTLNLYYVMEKGVIKLGSFLS